MDAAADNVVALLSGITLAAEVRALIFILLRVAAIGDIEEVEFLRGALIGRCEAHAPTS